MYCFFGLLLSGGAHHDNKIRVADLWNSEHGRAIYASTMPRNRFTQLLSAIRFDVRENDKFAPICGVFEHIVTKFRSSYKAGEAVTVDEQLVTTRRRCPFKVYIPSKPGQIRRETVGASRCTILLLSQYAAIHWPYGSRSWVWSGSGFRTDGFHHRKWAKRLSGQCLTTRDKSLW